MATGETQTFCLRWNDFRSSLTSAFEGLRHDEELVDITLCCEGRKIKAHRMMLSACSPFFRDLLRENPCQHPVFFLRDVTFEDLWAIIEFVYRGEVRVAQSGLASFLRTAEMLQLRGLSEGETKGREAAPAEDRPPSVSPLPGSGTEHTSKRRCSPPPPPPLPPTHLLSSPSGAKRRKQADPEPVRSPEPTPHTPPEPEPCEVTVTPVKTELPEPGGSQPVVGFDPVSELSAFAGLQQMEALSRQALARHDLATGYVAGMPSHVLDQDQYAPGLLLTGSAASLEPRERQMHACDTCGKQYVTPGSLRKHRKVHLGETHCQLCDKVFSSVYRLQYHVNNIHSGSASVSAVRGERAELR